MPVRPEIPAVTLAACALAAAFATPVHAHRVHATVPVALAPARYVAPAAVVHAPLPLLVATPVARPVVFLRPVPYPALVVRPIAPRAVVLRVTG